jgi:hypothetical protein
MIQIPWFWPCELACSHGRFLLPRNAAVAGSNPVYASKLNASSCAQQFF